MKQDQIETPYRTRDKWSRESTCAKLSPKKRDSFLVFREGRPNKDDPRIAICNFCPVRDECLAYAIVHDEWGIWGGTTKTERKRVPLGIQMSLKRKAKREGWYSPLKDYLPQVEYKERQKKDQEPEEDQEPGLEENPLDRTPCPQAQEPLQSHFRLDEVPAFSL